MCTFHRQIHLCRHLCDISKNESELPTVSQKSCLFVFYQTRAPVWIFRIQSAAPTSQKPSTCERVELHEYIKQTWTDIMLSFWDKVNKSRIFFPLTWRSTGQGGWIKVGYTAYLIVTQGSLHRIKYAPLEMSTRLVPAPRKGTASILMGSHAAWSTSQTESGRFAQPME